MDGLKLQTPVAPCKSRLALDEGDRIMVLGSCFADNIGKKMLELGLEVCINPFGTLYNPVSICNSVARLEAGVPFTREDCVQMGSGSPLICSFSHHTSFARATEEEFLENANSAMAEASAFWKSTQVVLVTLGTAWIYEHIASGETVSNCLKIPAGEFRRRRLSVREVSLLLGNMVSKFPEKHFIFTLSPIRHLGDGAHGNQVSKATLLIGIEETLGSSPGRADYFPAYEILLDELRDYRFYAPDMVHPSQQTVDYLWERFVDWGFSEEGIAQIERRTKILRQSRHRPNNPS